MRKPIKEIENVLQDHGYSINKIICEVMKTFKLKTLCRQVNFQKQEGYAAPRCQDTISKNLSYVLS